MNKTDLYEKINNKLIASEKIPLADMKDPKKYGRKFGTSRQGIYYLYSDKDILLYIGKVGTGKTASLYMRMKGNGGGSHSKKSWCNEVSYGKYQVFEKMSNIDIERIERLCIQKNDTVYNDKYFDQSIIDELLGKI